MSTASSTESARARPVGIVVGVDGSMASLRALGWAISEAEQRGTQLDVVVAWSFPNQWAEGFNAKWADDSDYFARSAAAEAEQAIDGVLGAKPRPSWLHVHAIEGHPASVLLKRAQSAELLVVGSRGRGGFVDLLLGSVSTACVHHATCPTVVVPPN